MSTHEWKVAVEKDGHPAKTVTWFTQDDETVLDVGPSFTKLGVFWTLSVLLIIAGVILGGIYINGYNEREELRLHKEMQQRDREHQLRSPSYFPVPDQQA